MNVDEAMKVAKRESYGWYDDTHEAAPILAAEVERLRAELAEAKAEIESVIRLGPHPVKQVQMPLATFIRSRMVARWEYNALIDKLEKAETELAAAKAASVVPVGITDLSLCGGGQRIEFYIQGDKSDGVKMLAWLRDRMKERGNQ